MIDMEQNNNLLQIINEKTCNQFDFLRLKQVFFDVNQNACQINLIYPSWVDFLEEDKEKVKQIIKEYLNLDGALLVIKINKSFVEADLIDKEIFNFFKESAPTFYSSLQPQNVLVNVVNKAFATISFNLEEDLYNFFTKYNLDKSLLKYLEKSFCASFEVKTSHYEKAEVEDKFLSTRFETLKTQSDLNAIMGQTIDKYNVNDKKVLFGNEIGFKPRHISSIDSVMDNCVVAGKINFLTEKSYTSKRMKKNKDGTEEPIVKPYFSFTLKDDSSSIVAVVFPSKANYHKMQLLKNGDTVLVKGNISKFNEKFEISVKDISFCSIPNKNEIHTNVDHNEITEYRYIKPIKYSSAKQSNLFDSNQNLSREVQNQTYVVYDFETTGVDAANDEIIEIGALKIVNGVFSEVFSTLVKPKRPIPPEASKINRITDDMVANCYSIEQVICDFYLFCKDCQMVGYNNKMFDALFLTKAGKSVGLNFDNTQIDAFLLAKDKLKGLRNYKLATVSKYLEVNLIDAHRALNDVIATAEVFLKLY